jgi:DNA (cytosine-5)-methyltransferase 1
VGYVERDAFAASILVARMEDASLDRAPVWDDVASFDGCPWRGAVDIVTAGYPCQPFSVAGRRRGADDPRHLWPHVARIIGEVKPPFVFLENVAHHLRLGFPEVAAGLVGMGYRLAAGLFTAAEVGAPHKRERLFILAIREGDELADPARLLWNPVEWRQPDRTAAAMAHADGAERWTGKPEGNISHREGARRIEETGRIGKRRPGLADTDGQRWVQAECGKPENADLTHAAGMWMTPTARDHKDGATSLANTRVNGLLGRQVLTTPMAGNDSCEQRRTLNPLFVEALMGWPTGWTGFASVATAWSLWLPRMRFELSQLSCWPVGEGAPA